MQTQGAHGIPLVLLVGFCLAAWVSGAIFGYGLREIRHFIQSRTARAPSTRGRSMLPAGRPEPLTPLRSGSERPAPEPPKWALSTPPSARRRKRRYRRGGGYYFSEETRGWGDGRWRRRAAWVTAAAIMLMVGGSVMFAASTYKPSHPRAPGLRH